MRNGIPKLLRLAILVGLGFAMTLSAFNALMDPYLNLGMPRIPGLNARKPVAIRHEALAKGHDVIRARPRTLVLGSSPNDEGFDADDKAWPSDTRPVYNLAFAGGNTYMSYRLLQHALYHGPVKLVILGLNPDFFLTSVLASPPKVPEFERRLAVQVDGIRNAEEGRQSARDYISTIFSLNTLPDSFSTLIGNLTGDSLNMVSGRLELDSERAVLWGTYRAFTLENLVDARALRGRDRSQYEMAMRSVKGILDVCRKNGCEVILIINPLHADKLEVLDRLGYWGAFENWKRDLLSLTFRDLNEPGNRFPLWDFASYDAYSTESVPADGRSMRWYTDCVHYNTALGSLIIGRVFGAGDSAFGELLSRSNLESRLKSIRQAQLEYRTRQPADAQRAAILARSPASFPPTTFRADN